VLQARLLALLQVNHHLSSAYSLKDVTIFELESSWARIANKWVLLSKLIRYCGFSPENGRPLADAHLGRPPYNGKVSDIPLKSLMPSVRR
jgi:hypothetical protein